MPPPPIVARAGDMKRFAHLERSRALLCAIHLETLAVEMISRGLAALLGAGPLVDARAPELVHAADAPTLTATLERLRVGALLAATVEVKLRTESGLIPVELFLERDPQDPLPHAFGMLNDLRNLNRRTEDLRQRERRARTCMEATLDAVFLLRAVYDDDGEVVEFNLEDMNARALQRIGRPRSELVGRGICELFPSNRGGIFQRFRQVFITGEPYQGSFEMPHPFEELGRTAQQVVRWDEGVVVHNRFEQPATPLSDTAHRSVGAQLEAALNLSTEGYVVFDGDNQLLFMNEAAALRCEREMGRAVAEHPAVDRWLSPLHPLLARCRERGGPVTAAVMFMGAREGLPMIATCKVLSGGGRGEVVICHLQEDLRASAPAIDPSSWAGMASDTIHVVASTAGVIWDVGPTFEQVLGYAPEELIGRASQRLLHPDILPEFQQLRERHLSGELPGPLLLPVLHKDGRTIWLEARFERVEGQGREPMMRVHARDVTDRERQRRLLDRNRAWQEAGDVIATAAAGVDDPRAYLQLCIETVTATLKAPLGLIAQRVDPSAGSFVVRGVVGFPEPLHGPLLSMGAEGGVFHDAIARGEPVRVPDLAALGERANALLTSSGARSVIVVPLLRRDEVVGVLAVASPRAAHFGPMGLRFGELIGRLIALGLLRSMSMQAFQESERRLRGMLETMPVLLIALDEHWRVVAWNRECARVTGLTAAEMLGQVPDEPWRSMLHGFSEEASQREHVVPGADGAPRVILWTPVPQSFRVPGWSRWAVGLDVTERRRAAHEAEAQRRTLDTILRSLPNVVYMIDVERGTFDFLNASAERIVGYTPEEVVGLNFRTFRDRIHPDFRPQLRDRAAHIFTPGQTEPYIMEVRARRRDGRWIDVLDQIQAIEHSTEGRPLRLLGVMTDITALKEARAERESLIARLEEQNAELERFAYTVSHDLKGPLITIQGFVRFIQQSLEAGDVERVREDLSRIERAADRMQGLLREVLDLSRVGRVTGPADAIPMSELADEVVELLYGVIAARGVQVEVAADMPVVRGDRGRLRELLQNLIENAVKFMGDQPAPRVGIGADLIHGERTFFVRDNGVGVAQQHLERIFELFERLSTDQQGSGVGLALSRRIVSVHGGRIWAESEGVGLGTTIRFTLPIEPPQDAP